MHFVFGDPGHLPHLPERAFNVTDACGLVRVRCHIEHPCDQGSQLAEDPETTMGPLGKVDGFLRTKQPFARVARPSREAATSGRVKRKGAFRSWCRVSRFHKPIMSAPINSFAALIEPKSGNSPPHRPSTVLIGEADITGVAMLPRKRVRTS